MAVIENDEDGITLIADYKANKALRDSFNRLVFVVFGFDLEAWYQQGFWDDRYICHSILQDNEVIANVSVSKMNLMINGVNKKAIQIGTVMTHPDFRGKGYSDLLMKRVLNIYEQECELFFLFANNSVLDFYPKLGFTALPEAHFILNIPRLLLQGNMFRKLNCFVKKDVELVMHMLLNRKPISEQFGVIHNQGIFMFHALNFFAEFIYYSQEDDAIIVFQIEGKSLHLYDIVCHRTIDFARLLPRMATKFTETIHFYFTPDPFTDKATSQALGKDEDILFVKTKEPLDINLKFRIPKIAHA